MARAKKKKKKTRKKAKKKTASDKTTAKHGKVEALPDLEMKDPAAEVAILPGSARARLLDTFFESIDKPVAKRLQIESPIDAGGMAVLNSARDVVLQREVAKKTIHSYLREDRRALFLFMREARITAQLDHPHIVPVHEVGHDPDGSLFFTMKKVSGRTLGTIYKELPDGPIPRDTLLNVLDIFLKICDAVSFAHSRGVLHCDLKPENVMVGAFGQVYVMDWGIARVMRDTSTDVFIAKNLKKESVVSTFSVMGSPAYMSPEQTLGERSALDPRTDVFSLGGILYEMFVGHPPYPAPSPGDALDLGRFGEYVPPSREAPDRAVPIGLERIINRATEVDRELRYQTVEAMREDVARYLREGAEFPSTHFPAGTVIIREGDDADAAYIITSGRCEVRRTRNGETEVLRVLERGEVVGETALLSPGPRTADVVAVTETEVLVISKAYLDAELNVMKPWLARMLRTVAERFRGANQ
jgi:serine/threonine-protein kinase